MRFDLRAIENRRRHRGNRFESGQRTEQVVGAPYRRRRRPQRLRSTATGGGCGARGGARVRYPRDDVSGHLVYYYIFYGTAAAGRDEKWRFVGGPRPAAGHRGVYRKYCNIGGKKNNTNKMENLRARRVYTVPRLMMNKDLLL